MNPLHLLPPERAHQLTLWALRHGLGPRQRFHHPALRTTLLGRELPCPIGLAAGAEKRGEALLGWSRLGFGMVEAGTVTPHPRPGNPSPRLWRVGKGGVVNWMGLPGAGIAPFVANLQAFHHQPERQQLLLGASIAAPDEEDAALTRLAAACAPWVDYLTLNASCPNLAHACTTDPTASARQQLAAAVAGADGVPVLLKLGPSRDVEAIARMVDGAMAAGAAGIVATNTLPWERRELADGLAFDWPQHHHNPVGGYSGPALLAISRFMVTQCRQRLGSGVPIIGVGGVQSGADAVSLLDAGADAIQLYSGLIYRGAGLLREIADALIVQGE